MKVMIAYTMFAGFVAGGVFLIQVTHLISPSGRPEDWPAEKYVMVITILIAGFVVWNLV